MNTNEDIRDDTSEVVIELGVASTETQGKGPFIGELHGERNGTGITDE